MNCDSAGPGILPMVKRLLYTIVSLILSILGQFMAWSLWTISTMGPDHERTDNSYSNRISEYFFPFIGGQRSSHGKGISSAGKPASSGEFCDGRQTQASYIPDIKAVPHYDPEPDTLEKTNIALKDQVRRLKSEVQSLQQGQDFRSYSAKAGTPHDELQLRFRSIRNDIIAWSRMVQEGSSPKTDVSMLSEHLDKVLGLGNAREIINHEDSTQKSRQEIPITICDLFAAIASNIIVEQAVLNPLISCTRSFRGAMNSKVYEMMSSDRSSKVNQKAAKMWQSACLKMYDLSDEFGSKHDKKMAREKCIGDILTMVYEALRLEFHDEAHQMKLQRSISNAVDIGKELGQLLSGLVPMDTAWLHEHADGDGFISVSTMGSRIELRSPPARGTTIVKGRAALVLFPGLLKYGSDDGEHWDSWTVWIPAKIHLMDEHIENIAAEVHDPHVLQPPAKIARSDNGMEWNGMEAYTSPQGQSERGRSHRRLVTEPPHGRHYMQPAEELGYEFGGPWAPL